VNVFPPPESPARVSAKEPCMPAKKAYVIVKWEYTEKEREVLVIDHVTKNAVYVTKNAVYVRQKARTSAIDTNPMYQISAIKKHR